MDHLHSKHTFDSVAVLVLFCNCFCCSYLKVDWDAQGNYSTTLFSDEAVKIVQNHDTSKPLYLYHKTVVCIDHISNILFLRYLAYQAVHAPREVPQQYVTPYNNVIKDSERRTFAVNIFTHCNTSNQSMLLFN